MSDKLITPKAVKNPSILLYGGGCVGKSFCLATLFKLLPIRPNQRVVILTTENNSIAGLERGLQSHNIKLENNQLFIAEVRPKQKKAFRAKLNALKGFAGNTVSQNFSTEKGSNANKDKYTYLINVISKLTSLTVVDYVSKETSDLGNIAELEKEDILVIDGLSPITHGIWNLVQGDKLTNDQNDYQIVQKQLNDITSELVNSIDCGLIMLAHEEEDKKDKLHPALNCGQALHGKYIGHFTDTFYAYKNKKGVFVWAGQKLNIETGARNLPSEDNLVPDFSLYNFYHDNGKV